MSGKNTTNADRLDRIAACGVVGAGGAGFPTHVKLGAKAETIILNAAECEPLLHKDREMLRRFGREIINGLRICAELAGATDIVVGIKGKYEDVIEQIEPMLPMNGRLVRLHDSYPSGDEFILVYDVTGKIIPPGKIPLDVGCVVTNVETAYNVARNKPITEKFLTVAGAVRNPCTVRVPVGITFAEAVELAGGITADDPRFIAGGVMMGALVSPDDPITKTCGGLIVLNSDHFVARRYEAPWKTIARIGASACDQCSFCTEFCPRYLLGHPIEPHRAMRSLGFVVDREPQVLGTMYCCECNLCTMMACPEDLDPKNVCSHNKAQLAADGIKWEVEAHPYRAELHLDNRRVPISRLINKMGLHAFENAGPLIEETCAPARVTLPLKQHIGAPAIAVVEDGSRVETGDVIAKPDGDQLGAFIHASIAGICSIHDDQVVIDANAPRQTALEEKR